MKNGIFIALVTLVATLAAFSCTTSKDAAQMAANECCDKSKCCPTGGTTNCCVAPVE